MNRNIREALGQDVRFVVAGRSELNEVIGEAYSGTLRAVAPTTELAVETVPEPEPELKPDATPLRVDSSVPPAAGFGAAFLPPFLPPPWPAILSGAGLSICCSACWAAFPSPGAAGVSAAAACSASSSAACSV